MTVQGESAERSAKKPATPKASMATKRGVGYPSMSLADAATALKRLGGYGTTLSLDSLASHLGHKTPNSGPFKSKVAALRDWGVIKGKGDVFELTPIGLAIALPTGNEDEGALQEAFFHASVFADIYRALAKDYALEIAQIANTAVRNHGVAAVSRDDFARSFVASAIAAGLAQQPDEGHLVLLTAHADAQGTDGQDGESGRRSEANAGLAESKKDRLDAVPVLRQTWPAGQATVLLEIRATRPLAAGEFEEVGKVVAAIERLVQAIAPKASVDASN